MACAIHTDSGNLVLWTKPTAYQPLLYYDIYRLTSDVTATITTAMIVGKVTFATTHFFDAQTAAVDNWYRLKSIGWSLKSSSFSNTISANIVPFYHTATSLLLNVGTSTGTITDLTTMYDSAAYVIGEVAGAPGIDLEIYFTAGITTIQQIVVNAYYDGSQTHAIRIQLYNYTTSAWATVHTLNDGRDYEQHYKRIIDDTPFISSGTASMRLYHTEGGNNAHDLYVDYCGLTRK